MPQEFPDAGAARQTMTREPIAMIGIGCRFPGGVQDVLAFWRLLANQVDAISDMPPSRFDIEAFYDPQPATPGKVVTRQGGFLDGIERFDANFFGVSPREAERLDPQQRLLLETTWEALEDGGQTMAQISGSQTGVFVGLCATDYAGRLSADPAEADFYGVMGTGAYSASGRIAYTLNLQGPSITINTHFSSALVAVHYACQSLWNGEATLALAGGASLILQPHTSVAYSGAQMLAPDGRSKFADARANGYARSEGAAMILLKPLAAAVAAGDPIYAVIRGSAVNHNGRSSGFLSAPSAEGQASLLRQAFRHAGVSPAQLQYVEAHGTGTPIGDAAELQALGSIMAGERPASDPCYVGSVKTNLGHTEAAAGIAGLIKVALMLKHRQIPASLHLQTPNPAVAWDELPIKVPTQLTPWPEVETAVAGVTSLGISGTNAHVVLSSVPIAPRPLDEAPRAYLLPLSAYTPQALRDLARAYLRFLNGEWTPPLRHICYSAACRRSQFVHRLAVVGETHEEMAEQLEHFLDESAETMRDSKLAEPWRPAAKPRVAYLFSGQGSQWLGMGRELLQNEPLFQQVIAECEAAMRPFVDWSLRAQLLADEADPAYRLNDIDVIQPTLLSLQIALASLWQSWGIQPEAVIGHSMGEVAAAYVAGVLTLSDAMRVICNRSQLMRRTSGQGAMAVAELSLEEVAELQAAYPDKLSLAASNGPRSVILSGDSEVLGAISAALDEQGTFCRLIKVDVASHSIYMEPLRPELEAALEPIRPRAGTVPIYSSTLGEVIDGAACGAAYWGHNLRQPIQFSKMVQQLLADGFDTFIEMSPHPVLLTAVLQNVEHRHVDSHVYASLRREQPEKAALLLSLAEVYMRGATVAWEQIVGEDGRFVRLPFYQWQRERYWIESPFASQPPVAVPAKTSQAPASQGTLRDRLLALEPGRRRQQLFESFLREQIGRVLRMPPARVPRDKPLKTLGLDSLMAVELKSRLENGLDLKLSATLVWNYPTITRMADFLSEKLGVPLQASPVMTPGTVPESATAPSAESEPVDDADDLLLAELDVLDVDADDDVVSLLADELAAIDDLLKGDNRG